MSNTICECSSAHTLLPAVKYRAPHCSLFLQKHGQRVEVQEAQRQAPDSEDGPELCGADAGREAPAQPQLQRDHHNSKVHPEAE